MPTQHEKARTFRALHERDTAFVIPNPWDVGSARILAALGFEALATTSSGFAMTQGAADGDVDFAGVLQHCAQLATATALPISVDAENGYAHDPKGVAQAIERLAQTGVVGCSIEDYSGDADTPIYDFSHAVERVQAAVEAADKLDFEFTLTARAEGLLRTKTNVEEVIGRLQAFAEVGAHVVYAPALRTLDDVRDVCAAVSAPVNVLAPLVANATVEQFSQCGVKRLSVGGALARAVAHTLVEAGTQMSGPGSFSWTKHMSPSTDLERMLRDGAP